LGSAQKKFTSWYVTAAFTYPSFSLPNTLVCLGSMTGAPKKRSVEILQTLEDHNRSLYSGVFGYWCVGGSGDFSVTIRSCFKYDSRWENKSSGSGDVPRDLGRAEVETEDWVIGAGGAITALSDPEAEWDEMTIKLQSVLRSFDTTEFLPNQDLSTNL